MKTSSIKLIFSKFIMMLSAAGAIALFFGCATQAKEPKRGPVRDISVEVNVLGNLPDGLDKEAVSTVIESTVIEELHPKDYSFDGIQGTLTVSLISLKKTQKEIQSEEGKKPTIQNLYSVNISAKLGNAATGKVVWTETIKYPKSSFLNELIRTFDEDEPEEAVQKAVRSMLKGMPHASTDPIPATARPLPKADTAKPSSTPKEAPAAIGKSGKASPPAKTEMLTDESGQKWNSGLKLHAWTVPSGFRLENKIPSGPSTGTLTLTTNPPFSPGYILNSATLKNYYKQKMAFVWDGYVRIKESGPHIIIVEMYNKGARTYRSVTFCIYVDEELKASAKNETIRIGENHALTADVNLSPGMHRLQIPFDCDSRQNSALPYDEIATRIRLKGPEDEEAVELKAKDFYYPVKK